MVFGDRADCRGGGALMRHLTEPELAMIAELERLVDACLRARDARLAAERDLERYREKLAEATRRAEFAALELEACRRKQQTLRGAA